MAGTPCVKYGPTGGDGKKFFAIVIAPFGRGIKWSGVFFVQAVVAAPGDALPVVSRVAHVSARLLGNSVEWF